MLAYYWNIHLSLYKSFHSALTLTPFIGELWGSYALYCSLAMATQTTPGLYTANKCIQIYSRYIERYTYIPLMIQLQYNSPVYIYDDTFSSTFPGYILVMIHCNMYPEVSQDFCQWCWSLKSRGNYQQREIWNMAKAKVDLPPVIVKRMVCRLPLTWMYVHT